MIFKSFLILFITVTALVTAMSLPSQAEIEEKVSKGEYNVIYYVIAVVIIIGFMVGLCSWTASKGVWSLIKTGLFLGSGAALFYLIVQAVIDAKNS
ncbi:hypothetical protein PVAND_017555 [Polypedilum vanderplanki]|uniref:TrbC/VIRB2 family protein n=1 Tax=Polypedilum vanderplanki TaxID=319348 RepID=A0A9J6BJ10_POLVA|nr:hypothetical protein PVAND_017555 [Polypedilum vanderplanki]